MFNNSKVLITGGTGSWANELVKQLLRKYKPLEIVLFSRGELQQVSMQRSLEEQQNLRFTIGDVRDYASVYNASQDMDYIFHMAALKHVPICEEYPLEAIKTNIYGTENVIRAAVKNKVKKVIFLSTDKAASPSNLYGMTKGIAEKLIINANKKNTQTKFICIRGGNVLGSNGSIVPMFIERIKNKKDLYITHERMTRFFLTLKQAISLLFKASEVGIGGEIFVMKMPSMYIKDIAEVLMDHYGETNLKISNIREGEKIDELLISEEESKKSFIFDENYYLILPSNYECTNVMYPNLEKTTFTKYESSSHLVNKDKIFEMLKSGGFIK